jgi:hypothetical protein
LAQFLACAVEEAAFRAFYRIGNKSPRSEMTGAL